MFSYISSLNSELVAAVADRTQRAGLRLCGSQVQFPRLPGPISDKHGRLRCAGLPHPHASKSISHCSRSGGAGLKYANEMNLREENQKEPARYVSQSPPTF
jgi:hypothetical protein